MATLPQQIGFNPSRRAISATLGKAVNSTPATKTTQTPQQQQAGQAYGSMPTTNRSPGTLTNYRYGEAMPRTMTPVNTAPTSSTVAASPGTFSQYGPLYGDNHQFKPTQGAVAPPPTANQDFYNYAQPFGTPNNPNTGPVVSSYYRTGIDPGQLPSISDFQHMTEQPLNVAKNYLKPYQSQNYGANPYLKDPGQIIDQLYNETIGKKASQGREEFGIPQSVQQQMKVQAANETNSAYSAQRDAARRMLAKSGLLNDSAMIQMEGDLAQQRNADIFKRYSDIDIQNALEGNKQYQQNMNEVIDAAMGKSKLSADVLANNANQVMNYLKLNEGGRQFDATAGVDYGKLALEQPKTLGDYATTLMKDIFMPDVHSLEQIDLDKLKALWSGSSDIDPAARSQLAAMGSIVK